MILTDNLRNIYNSQKDELTLPHGTVKREGRAKFKILPGFASIITGIRRCGKSTFMKQLIHERKGEGYFNFEDTRISSFELNDFSKLEEIIKKGKSEVLFFDEIQNVKGWERYIRTVLDKKLKIVITGSNASMLSKELGTKLTGRNLRYELFPFSFMEFCNFKNIKPGKNQIESYIECGGFPEFLRIGDPTILRMLFDDIINRDIIVKNKIKNSELLKQIALRLVSDSGNIVSISKLAKDFEIKSKRSASQYLSYLKDSYLFFTIPMFAYSPKKQIRNPQKIYSIDTGLVKANTITFTKDFGRLLENAVFLQLRRMFSSIYYFKMKRECDFVTARLNKIEGVYQVCLEINNGNEKREIEGLIEAVDFFKLRKGIIITLNQEDEFKIAGKIIKIIPAWKWMSINSSSVKSVA